MAKAPSQFSSFAASIVASAVDADGVPLKRVQLLAMGETKPRNGQPKIVVVADRAHAEQIVAASRAYAGATDPVIDYDHQTVFAANPQVGGRAPAAGWIKQLTVEDDGIWADVEWTPAAASALDAREYRYISPYFDVEKATGRVRRIINAGLTNTPNLDLAVVASAISNDLNEEDDDEMDLSKIAEALGLPAEATVEEILGMISDWKTAKATMSATASVLGLAANASTEAFVAAATAARGEPDPSKYVPIAALKDVQAELGKIADQRVTASVDAAVAGGKLTPSQRDWALRLGRKDEAELEAYLASAHVIIAPGAQTAVAPDPKSDDLSDSERAVASALGLSPEAYLAARKEEA